MAQQLGYVVGDNYTTIWEVEELSKDSKLALEHNQPLLCLWFRASYYILRITNQQMQLYAVTFIPLLGSLYMFRVFYAPIIRSTILKTVSTATGTDHSSSQLLTPSVACRPHWE